MRRILGLVPVLLLTVATVVSAAVGIRLSHRDTGPDLAAELGCAHVVTSRPHPGIRDQTCSLHGGRVDILTLDKGDHGLYSPDLLEAFVIAPAGESVVVTCQRRADCAAIHDRWGGQLDSGPVLGISLMID